MGSLNIPHNGVVYVDAMVVIYTVERFAAYWPLVEPLWQAAKVGTIELVSSELTVMEALVKPIKSGDAILLKAFDQALQGSEMRLLPITQGILREAAQLRATTKLRTPDALHLATAQQAGCVLFVTNDIALRGMTAMPLAILDDFLAP